jgi:hypothetical protein
MKIKLKIEKEFEVKRLFCAVGVRYWEDATVNGNEDINGDLIPCRNGDLWCPKICIDSGIILNWDFESEAKIHYKVCDHGTYHLELENGEVIKSIEGYVPDIMCPERGGYGDYIIMNVDKDGQIKNWNPSFDEWLEDDD